MPQLEEVEKLSAWLAGDLSEEEGRRVALEVQRRPDLRAAVDRLRALDRNFATAAAVLAQRRPDPAIERAIHRVNPRRGRGPWMVAAAALAAAAVVAGVVFLFAEGPSAPAPSETAAVASAPDTQQEASRNASVPSGDVIAVPGGELGLTVGAQLHHAAVWALEQGTVLARGTVDLESQGSQLQIDGEALVTTEPFDTAVRDLEEQQPLLIQGDDLRTIGSWKRLVATASLGLSVGVLEGTATIARAEGGPVVLAAGETFPAARNAGAPLLAEAEVPAPGAEFNKNGTYAFFDSDKMHQATRALAQQLESCAAVCHGADCLGAFELDVTLVEDQGRGRVTQIDVAPDYSIQNPLVISCVEGLVSKAQLPPPLRARQAQLTLPFVGSGPDGQGRYHLESMLQSCDADDGKPMLVEEMDNRPAEKIQIEGAPSLGPVDAKVTLVEFADFECPFCVRVEATIDQLLKKYDNQIRFVFRNNPLPFHPHAQLAAQAARAAQEQGKFWEYRKLLFENTNALDRASLIRWAKEVGLDASRFTAALDSDEVKAAVAADQAEAVRVKASGTPTFFVNGRPITGAQPIEVFQKAIDQALRTR